MKTPQPNTGAARGYISVDAIKLRYDESQALKPEQQFSFHIVAPTAQDGVVGTRTGSHAEPNLRARQSHI